MKIRDDYKDVLIVDERGRVEYFSGPSVELFDLKPEALTGIKVTQLYRNLNEDDSIMVRTLKHGETPVRIVQELDLEGGKVIRQESDTFAIQNGDSVIGAIGFAYYDMEKDAIEKPREAGARRPEENAGLSDITGESEAAREIRRRIAKIADLNTSVFLTGETGTGKELTARIIHNTSKRKKENFVYVNCGTLPKT